MKINMVIADRFIRLVLGFIFVVLFSVSGIPATVGVMLLVSAFYFFLTSFVGVCPVYKFLGL